MRISEADVRGQVPDAMAQQRAQIAEGFRAAQREFERTWSWWVRRNRALMILGGWQPPSPARLWWDAYEDDALVYAEGFEPD